MNAEAILEAVRELRGNLRNAIDFSTGAGLFNMTFSVYLEGVDDIEPHYRRALDRHQQWHDAYMRALETLDRERYPIHDTWRAVNLSVPQLCFSLIPVDRFTDGSATGKVWIIGCGDNPEGARIPADAPDLTAGDILLADGTRRSCFPGRDESYDYCGRDTGIATDCAHLAGILHDGEVRRWEAVYRDTGEAEQRLVESQLAWRLDEPLTNEGKIKPSAATVDVIRSLEKGKTTDEIAAETGKSADNIRQIGSRWRAGRYAL